MSVFKSRVSRTTPSYDQNRREMLALVDKLRALEGRAIIASARRNETFAQRGQTPPHERVSRLLDPGLPFLRLHTLSNFLVEDDDWDTSVPGASIIAGIGYVSGVRCLVWCDDSGINAGALTATTVSKAISLQEIALRQKLPLVHLVESAGANLVNFLVENWNAGGVMFRNLARLSAAGIPTVVVLHGPSTAGGAYMPGMSDYVIGVKRNGMAALGGAALVKAATGEVTDNRELGGSEMHASVSGVVDYLEDDDDRAIARAREVVARLDWNRHVEPAAAPAYRPPRYDPEELAGVVPVDYRVSYDVREVLARVVDDSDIDEFKAGYGPMTVCCYAAVMGQPCGFIGNNGPLDPEGSTKAAQFMQLCDQAQLPIVYLHNITGYMVGAQYERVGMIKHGSKMVQAATNVRVPRIALYIGASFGAGNYGMCGQAYEPDFLFAWPNAATNVMGGEQAARTMSELARTSAARRGETVDEAALKAREAKIKAHFERQQSAFYTAGRNLSHGVIDPRDTRRVLGFTLSICDEARRRTVQPNSFGVARL